MLDLILKRADLLEADTFSADEVGQWPPGALDRLLAAGLVREIAPANGVVCDQCEDACWIEPEIREDPRTGKRIGRYFCRIKEVGWFTVDLERLRQWQVQMRGLAEASSKALSAAGGVQEIAADRLYWLGRILLSGKSHEVFLGRGLAWPDAPGLFGQAKRLRAAKAPIVLVPSAVPPEEEWNGQVPTVRALREIASLSATGLTIASAHLVEQEAASGRHRALRKMLRGWKEICGHLGRPPGEWRSLKLLNKTQGGPISSLGKGKPPEVWSDALDKWWEDQEGRHQALREKQESAQATLSDSFAWGRKSETVIPGVAMHVRKRRKGQGRPRNDNH